jgi:hypothetical protein
MQHHSNRQKSLSLMFLQLPFFKDWFTDLPIFKGMLLTKLRNKIETRFTDDGDAKTFPFYIDANLSRVINHCYRCNTFVNFVHGS